MLRCLDVASRFMFRLNMSLLCLCGCPRFVSAMNSLFFGLSDEYTQLSLEACPALATRLRLGVYLQRRFPWGRLGHRSADPSNLSYKQNCQPGYFHEFIVPLGPAVLLCMLLGVGTCCFNFLRAAWGPTVHASVQRAAWARPVGEQVRAETNRPRRSSTLK